MEGEINKANSLAVCWCDPGYVESPFMASVVGLMMNAPRVGLDGIGFIENVGNQIARQRGDAIREFLQSGLEWCLWIDSDIVFDFSHFEKIWALKDKEKYPLISGVYFITMEPMNTLYVPHPCIFKKNEEGQYKPVHPLPDDEFMPIDSAGFGFVLMHKSVAEKMRDAYGNTSFEIVIGDNHVSEDMGFFMKAQKIGIPIYAHTGIRVAHRKPFMLDENYYKLWWDVVAPVREQMEAEMKKANDNNI